jgi:hypothetical protein
LRIIEEQYNHKPDKPTTMPRSGLAAVLMMCTTGAYLGFSVFAAKSKLTSGACQM